MIGMRRGARLGRLARVGTAIAVMAAALPISMFGAASPAGAAGSVTVQAGDAHWIAWNDQTDATGGTLTYVSGPGAAAPAGTGSAQLSTTATNQGYAALNDNAIPGHTRFDAITELKYSTYRESFDAGNNLAVTMQINADYDVTDASNQWQGRLVFEPYQTASVPRNTWQTWNTMAGKWWMTSSSPRVGDAIVPRVCGQSDNCTWNDVITAYPNVGMNLNDNKVLFKAGSGWANFKGEFDKFVVDLGSGATTYDFEPTASSSTKIVSNGVANWGFVDDNANGGSGAFVAGPASPPAGFGSGQLGVTATNQGYTVQTNEPSLIGTRLDSLSALQYSTYRQTSDGGQDILAPSLFLNVDYDLTDASSAWQGRLIYEPYNTFPAGVPQNTWQDWNTLTGKWYMTGNAVVNGSNVGKACPMGSECTLSTLLASYPNAGIHATYGAMGSKVGSNWSTFTGNVDKYVVGINGATTTYDLEGDPEISIAPTATVAEAGTAAVNVTLNHPVGAPVTVDYATSDGTAVAPGDYTSTSGSFTFAAGETTKTISIPTVNDNVYEGSETVNAAISNPGNATLSGANGNASVVTITDAADIPTVAIASTFAQNEGNAGTSTFAVPVTLSNPSDFPVSVDYATADGTATAPGDYTAVAGSTITFAAGETAKTADVSVNGDTTHEANETISVSLSNLVGTANLGNAGSTATITNDDGVPVATIEATGSAAEGSTDDLTISLSNPSDQTVTVDYSTANGTATVADNDYSAIPAGQVSFAPGETSKDITVGSIDDNIYEANQTYSVSLTGATNASVGGASTATMTIVNNDSKPTVTIAASGSASEGNPVNLSVTLSHPTDETVTVKVNTADGTAVAPGDYAAIVNATVTFNPRDLTKTVTVNTVQDPIFEGNEDLTVTISDEANAAGIVNASATATIVDDDSQPTISITDNNGAENGANIGLTVSLSNPSATTITVDYATADGTATTADSDYTSASGTVTFTAGQTSHSVSVDPTADTKYELNETVLVNLSNASGATIADNQGVVTINNDDAVPTVSIAPSASVTEGGSVGVDVTLSNPSYLPISVNYDLNDGTATTADNDYVDDAATLSWTAGTNATKTITVATNGDNKFETNETVTVALSGVVNASVGTATSTVTINNDDAQPTVTITPTVSGNEGTTLTANVTLSNPSYQVVTVNYATANGTATVADNDYVAASGTVTFPVDNTAQVINVSTVQDNIHEADQTFTVTLSAPSNTTVSGSGVSTMTILNDDSQPTISIQSASSAPEGNAGTTTQNLTVTLSNPTDSTLTVDYASADGTATVANTDYVASSGTLTFSGRSISEAFSVTINGDLILETDETFTVTLSNNNVGTIGTATSTVTIANDDALTAFLGAGPISTAEGAGGGLTPVNIPVTLSTSAAYPITVNYTTVSATAKSTDLARDYVKQTGAVVFAPGDTVKNVTVIINDDLVLEDFEHFYLKLTTSPGITVGTTQTKVIIENDEMPRLVMNNPAAQAEGKNIIFKVATSHRYYLPISVNVATVNGSATAPVDYDSTPLTPGVVPFTIAAGTKGPIPVTIRTNRDNVIEGGPETFSLSATSASVINSPQSATGTIKGNNT